MALLNKYKMLIIVVLALAVAGFVGFKRRPLV